VGSFARSYKTLDAQAFQSFILITSENRHLGGSKTC
jgi:hypothetical protein